MDDENRISILFFLTIFLVLPMYSKGQSLGESPTKFTHYSVEQGLRNSIVTGLVQDNDHFLWIATKDGINKFDGVEFQSYSLSGSQKEAASDNIVTEISQAAHSPLYCGTTSGNIYAYDSLNDAFKVLDNPSPDHVGYQINAILPLDEHRLLAGIGAHLFFLDNRSADSTRFINIGSNINELFLAAGRLWIGCFDGLYSLDASLGITSPDLPHQQITQHLSNAHVLEIIADNEAQIWVGTQKQGVLILDPATGNQEWLKDLYAIISDNRVPVRDIQPLPDGTLMIGMDGAGIALVDARHKITSTIQKNQNDFYSLSSNSIYDILFDAEGNLWVATYGGGLNFSSKPNHQFIKIQNQLNNPNSLKDNTASSVLETPDGNIWFGTQNGISILDRTTGQWQRLTGIPEQPVLSMAYAQDGTVWVGTYGNGLFNIPTGNVNAAVAIPLPGSVVNDIFTVMVDRQQRVWCGGIINNTFVYNPKAQNLDVITLPNVMSMYEHPSGMVYLGTVYGLWEVRPDDFSYERVYFDEHSLNRNRIYSIVADPLAPEAKLWLGTEGGGLLHWDRNTQRAALYSQQDGLSSDIIYGIEPDSLGNLWMSTTNGLSFFHAQDQSFTVYNYADGLSDQEFKQGAYTSTQAGELIFGGQHGFTVFHPDSLQKSSGIPRLSFTEFRLFGKTVEIGAEDALLNRHINLTSELSLAYHQNSVSFQFVALQFANPEKLQYQWKLEGFEDTWSIPSHRHEAIYTNLAPGHYSFLVRASNQDGIWGDNQRAIHFTIHPPIWKTVWAYIVYIILGLGLVTFIIGFARIRVKARNAREKTRFFANIAHDIKTPLTLIKAPIEAIEKEGNLSEEDTKWLNLATTNIARLNNLINQLLDFQKADQYKMKLNLVKVEINSYVKDIAASFAPLLAENHIHLTIAETKAPLYMALDLHKMEKAIMNLISNAIKYSHSNSEIHIILAKHGTELLFKIKDQGIGIPKKVQSQIFSRYYRANNAINRKITGSGVGLVVTQKFVHLHNGSISFTSSENKGTTFTMVLPIRDYKNLELVNQVPDTTPEGRPEPRKVAKDPPHEATLSDHKILVIEDNPDLLAVIGNALQKHYQVMLAENGRIGLDMAMEELPDLIVSDIMMPELDGKQVCQQLKSQLATSHIPVILLTALGSIENRIDGLNVGADAYIEKPFHVDMLLAQVANLIASRDRLRDKWKQLELAPEKELISNTLDAEFIEKIKGYILLNIQETSIPVEELAKEMSVSRSVLFRKVKAITGENPQNFIRLIKLHEAKKLLRQGQLSISQVAYDTGFSNPKFFSTSFKNHFGLSPSQYIKEQLD